MLLRICAAFVLACTLILSPFTSAIAQTPASLTTITGRILETSAGLPVGGAEVRLQRDATVVDTTTTAADGSFSFKNVAPGEYTMAISARGYETTRTQPLPVIAGEDTVQLQTAIAPLTGGLRQIASVSTSANASLQTSATINQSLSPSLIQDQNYNRAGDALATLPFVTSSTSSSEGDDEAVSLRGFNPTEGATLLDGHPFGPIGAHGTAYDYQIAQFWGFSNINVIYGSGATGLYGISTLAGAVDFDTINPTAQDHFTLSQGVGDLEKTVTGLEYTGTNKRLGYAFAYGVEGTDGEIDQNLLQSGDLNGSEHNCSNDPTALAYGAMNLSPPPTLKAQDIAACDYLVNGDYVNRNIVGKLTYQFDSKTSLLVSAYNSTDFADSPGNGDTDLVPLADSTFAANGLISSGSNNFTLLNGTQTNCSATTIAALNDSKAGFTCLTAQQYAKDFSGPAGAGFVDRYHAAGVQDYHARISRKIGGGTLVVDGYVDNYGQINDKGPLPASAFDDTFLTHGGLISDEYAGAKSDFSFGVSFDHQLHESNSLAPLAIVDGQSVPFGKPDVGLTIADTDYFAHETYSPTERFSIFADLTLDRSQNTSTTNFDPRISFVFHPTNSDVFRITGGRATSDPDPSLLTGGFVFSPAVANNPSFNPQQNCQPLIALGSGASPFVKPESANDIEVAAAHRFKNQATVELDVYDTVEQNPILTAVDPLSVVPASQLGALPGGEAAYFNAYITALQGPCGRTFSLADFGVTAPFNAGQADYKGANLDIKVPVTRQIDLNAGYTVQSAYYTGLSNNVLVNNTGLINNQQFTGIPLDTARIGLGYSNRVGEFSARIDSYYVGINNGLNRPAYWYANANLTKTVGPITFNLGISNLFNSAASQFGMIGLGVQQPQNQFGSNASALAEGSEEFGLPYRQLLFTTSFHI
jgi:hypothetical protein